ncbi:hypothetical protein AtNW77_Chr4g0280051 [Arabidopsis thaliana]
MTFVRESGRCVRRDVAECSRVISETGSSDTVADFSLAEIAAIVVGGCAERAWMMSDSDGEDDCVITGVRTVEQELAPEGNEIVMFMTT